VKVVFFEQKWCFFNDLICLDCLPVVLLEQLSEIS